MPLGFARSILTKVAAASGDGREPASGNEIGGVAGENYDQAAPQYYVLAGIWNSWHYYWNNVQVANGTGAPPASFNVGGYTYYKGTARSGTVYFAIYRIAD